MYLQYSIYFLSRSSKDISISLSDCGFGWNVEVEDTLSSAIGMQCQDIPLQEYTINKPARYVRFKALDYYGNVAALQYFNVEYDYPNGIVNEEFICPSNV